MNSPSFVNYAFYQFAKISDRGSTKYALIEAGRQSPSVRGTVLVTPEGINAYFAGLIDDMSRFLDAIKAIPGCQGIEPKISYSEQNPFRRLVIKNKAETIGLGVAGLDPTQVTGHYLKPLEFKKWMDENPNDFILVDTRNDYEVAIGTFEGAINPKISHFKEFPKWLEENLSHAKDKKIVTFCTGGIRCEKATSYMVQNGYKDVYQIEGGILKYLEETHDAKEQNHWNGDCFVFDHRVAVDKDLAPAGQHLCFACWAVLEEKDLAKAQYKKGEHCPHCYARQMEKRNTQARLAQERRSKRLEVSRQKAQAIRQTLGLGQPREHAQ